MADQDGNFMFPPGIGIGGTLSYWLSSTNMDNPIAAIDESIDFGKWGGISAGVTFGQNPETGALGIMEVHGTLAVGGTAIPVPFLPSGTFYGVPLASPSQ